ncbi:GNAT family N-acetyltransferase [Rhodoligotrophos defluvii]|uniref:GNAT family N-acetyltransferase n=1 Tax=Rhodoligotrophos defluvii TaxID=2561934 RepID=UPI0010C988D1|nr:GNAT family N-acetyltransferase [Rhodoligotrophos defluvii]
MTANNDGLIAVGQAANATEVWLTRPGRISNIVTNSRRAMVEMVSKSLPDQRDPTSGFQIVELSDRPDFAEEVAQINFRQWAEFSDLSLDEMRKQFAPRPQGEVLPVTFLAMSQGEVKALVSLRQTSLGAVAHPNVYLPGVEPWLSNMWVAESARGHKLATRLSIMVENRARELGYTLLYSSTAMENSLYHAIGFRTIAVREHKGAPVYIIRKEI